jgi:type I restriction enzyme S subunit
MTELEAFVRKTVQQMEKSQPQSLISPETDLESPFDPSAPPFWEIVAECAAEIPDEIWETVPEDASEQVDRYLYQSFWVSTCLAIASVFMPKH